MRIKSTKKQQGKKKDLISKSYAYLNDNFSSFSQANRIHIALEITKRNMVQKNEIDLSQNTVAALFGLFADDDDN